MKDGEITIVRTLDELRECPPWAVLCDARGRVAELAVRAGACLPSGIRRPGVPGVLPLSELVMPVQVWWPAHPEVVA